MLPLTVLSAYVAVLVLPVSAAPLPFRTSELQQPAGLLATPPGQAFAPDSRPASDAAPGHLRVPRGAGFREADYAVNVATAFRTAIPAHPTPVVPAAVAPTRTVLSRRSDSALASSSASGNKTQADHDEVVAPVALAAKPKPKPSPAGPLDLASAPGKGSSTQPLFKTNSLSTLNNALAAPLAQPHMAAAAPGPEARPKFVQTNHTLAQSQTADGDAPLTTVPQVGESAMLTQVKAGDDSLLTVTKDPSSTVPQVAGLGTDTNTWRGTDASAPRKIGTVGVESQDPPHTRRGALGLSRYLSGSTMYPESDPGSQAINPRGVESLLAKGRAPRRGARVKNSKGPLSLLGRAVAA